MQLRTYKKIIALFKECFGYMSFSQLQNGGITIRQIQELEKEGILEKFARGWYWCTECGFKKPKDSKYVEVSKVNPKSIICLDSACYVNGILKKEPPVIAVATTRNDRKKMEMNFPIRRFYLQNTEILGEICKMKSKYGDYQYYSLERSFCDCFRMKDKLDEDIYMEILDVYGQSDISRERILAYAKRLRAIQNLKNETKTAL